MEGEAYLRKRKFDAPFVKLYCQITFTFNFSQGKTEISPDRHGLSIGLLFALLIGRQPEALHV
jgi:hypothetical protein